MFIEFEGGEREEAKGGGERNIGVRHIDLMPPICDTTRNPTCDSGMCPGWGSNPQILGVQHDTSTSSATGPGLMFSLIFHEFCLIISK